MTSLADLEARVDTDETRFNALCEKIDRYRADTRTEFSALRKELTDHRQETRANFRAVDEQLAEIRDLIVGGFNGPRGQ